LDGVPFKRNEVSKKSVIVAMIAFLMIFAYKSLKFMALQWYSDLATLIEAICHAPQRIGVTKVHFGFACWIFTPVCKLMPCPYFIFFLIAMSALSVSIAGYVIYLISKELLESELASIAMMLAFYFSPDLHGLIGFDIHALSFALPFVALAAYYAIKDNPKRAYVLGLFALGFKESIALPMLGILLWRLTSKRSRVWEWGILFILIAFAMFILRYFNQVLMQRWVPTALSS